RVLCGAAVREPPDERQRQLPLGEVGAERLADAPLVAGEVEAVVDDLERDAEEAPVLVERGHAPRARAGVVAAEPRARLVEGGGLVLDDPQVLLDRQAEPAPVAVLLDLAPAHAPP